MDTDLSQLECEIDAGDLDYVEGIQEELQTSLAALLVIQVQEAACGAGQNQPEQQDTVALMDTDLAKIKVDIDENNLELAVDHIAELQPRLHSLIEIEVQGAECKSGGTHPIQPVVMVGKVARFKSNEIVKKLLDYCSDKGLDLNYLHRMDFSQEDHVQLIQLMGYSIDGATDLSFFPEDIIRKADAAFKKLKSEKDS